MMENQNMDAILLDHKRMAVHDGPGIRTTFFFKGCSLKCRWCHNPESISFAPQMGYFEHKCINCGECGSVCENSAHIFDAEQHRFEPEKCTVCGACEDVCIGQAMKLYGRRTTLEQALALALEDEPFYRNSGGGITVSGGEPLLQIDFAEAFLKALKEHGLHTAVDTCANVPAGAIRRVMPFTDLFLVDFKHADPEQHKRLTGADNTLICKNLKMLSDAGAAIEIRIPFVPFCNDSEENLRKTGEFLKDLNISLIRILPYHDLARGKYKAVSMPDTMPETDTPTDEQILHAAEILRQYGLNARSGKE